MTDLIIHLPNDVVERLHEAAESQDIPLDDLVREAIETYLADDEPTKEEILEGLREGFLDAFAGRTRPAREILDELRREMGIDADNS